MTILPQQRVLPLITRHPPRISTMWVILITLTDTINCIFFIYPETPPHVNRTIPGLFSKPSFMGRVRQRRKVEPSFHNPRTHRVSYAIYHGILETTSWSPRSNVEWTGAVFAMLPLRPPRPVDWGQGPVPGMVRTALLSGSVSGIGSERITASHRTTSQLPL